MERDRKKNQICREHGFELIRIENTYARRYQFMKDILMKYFASVKQLEKLYIWEKDFGVVDKLIEQNYNSRN